MSKQVDVCLVTMPLASIERPSIGLGLLYSACSILAALETTPLTTNCLYPNLAFAERITVENYSPFQQIKPDPRR